MTGGGSAGHVTPNLALIPRLQARGYEVHYIGTKDSIEESLIQKAPGVTFHRVRSGKLRRYFSWQNFTDPFRVIAGYFDASRAIKALKPAALFSKGGFVSVPVVMAGRRRKIPVVLHESDYSPGLANKIAMNFADRMLVTFEDTLTYTKHRGAFTGTPIRPELYQGDRKRGLDFLGFSGEKPVLLCMGGSLGAQRVNDALRRAVPTLTARFDIVHLCGTGKVDPAWNGQSAYRQFEYIGEELPDLFAASDIAVSRAGANSVFEFLAIALPALLIPLPLIASRGDQIQNARYFERKGYAMVLEEEDMTTESIIEAVNALYDGRERFRNAMQHAPNTDGTENVLRAIEAAAQEGPAK